MKKTRTAAIVLAAAMLLGSAGCGGASTGRDGAPVTTAAADNDVAAPAETTAGTNAADIEFTEAQAAEIDENQETGTIKVLIYYDLVSQDADLVTLFETRYGGSIEQEITTSGVGYFERLGTLVASDLSPDITRYEWMSFPHGVSRNIYTPIDSYIDLDSELWSGMKDIAEEFSYGGKHYYVPYKITSNFAINYNRLVLEEYGMSDPMELYRNGEWTWDTFRDLLVQWCDYSPDHIGYTGVNAMSFVATTGTKLIEVADTEIINNLKNENVQRCMEFLEDICRQGLTGEGYVDPGEAFVDGNLLFLGMEPTWTYGAACESLYKKNIEYDMCFVPFPRDPLSSEYNIAYDSFGYMIPSGAKNIKGAVDWITLNRTEVMDPDNIAKDKENMTDSSTRYFPKCSSCKHVFTEEENGPTCPECGADKKVKFFAYYTEEQYDLLQDMTTPANGKFRFLFDNVFGFNSDLDTIFQGKGEESLLDGPLFFDVSYTQLREANYNAIESILDDYREKLSKANG